MEKTIETKFIQIIEDLQAGIAKASEVAAVELSDIAQSYVVYGRAKHTTELAICLLILIGGAWAAKRFAKTSENISWILYAFATVPTGLCTIAALRDFLLVWTAPKVWLLQELAKLAKGV